MRSPIVVAIPARNEAARIGPCLQALASQTDAHRHIAAVAVFANNCTDETLAAARSVALPFPLHLVEAHLPPARAHIGYARRGATDAAFACMRALGLGDDAIIACTDADSRVAPGWLAALSCTFDGTVEAVCGAIDLDDPLSTVLAARLASETAYAEMVARVAHRLDPRSHDPWPNHIWCWGANFAVRARALAAVGGMPLVDLAEDRALHAELLRNDIPIRHSIDARVRTSARTTGRAPGGLADLMQQYASDPSAMADFALEPALRTWERARRRGETRRQFGDGEGFGNWWAQREAQDVALQRQRVALADLPAETAKLTRWLSVADNQSDIPASALAGSQ